MSSTFNNPIIESNNSYSFAPKPMVAPDAYTQGGQGQQQQPSATMPAQHPMMAQPMMGQPQPSAPPMMGQPQHLTTPPMMAEHLTTLLSLNWCVACSCCWWCCCLLGPLAIAMCCIECAPDSDLG